MLQIDPQTAQSLINTHSSILAASQAKQSMQSMTDDSQSQAKFVFNVDGEKTQSLQLLFQLPNDEQQQLQQQQQQQHLGIQPAQILRTLESNQKIHSVAQTQTLPITSLPTELQQQMPQIVNQQQGFLNFPTQQQQQQQHQQHLHHQQQQININAIQQNKQNSIPQFASTNNNNSSNSNKTSATNYHQVSTQTQGIGTQTNVDVNQQQQQLQLQQNNQHQKQIGNIGKSASFQGTINSKKISSTDQKRKEKLRYPSSRQVAASHAQFQYDQQHQYANNNSSNNNNSATTNDRLIEIDSETDSNHDTALTLACAGGHEDLVELLLSRKANIEHRDKKGFTPLILAATAGHEKVVETLINNGADLEAQSERTKDTPLSLACSGGRYEVVELLLRFGANKEHRNVSDYTPLSLAASGGYVNIIKLLLNHGAEINSRTGSKLGISPLMLAAMNGHTAAVRLLLDMGSDINAQIETNRNTALTLACFQGRHEVVNLLLDRKANVEHRAKTGLTPLMEAASGGYIEVGRVLLDKGADVNAAPVPSSRDTALTIAADKGHLKFVELLLSRGAAVEVKNKKGNSPLWLAANGGHLGVVEVLYNAKACIDSQDIRKLSCLMAAFKKGHVKVVKWMVNHVTQFPSDQEMTRNINIADKEVIDKCHECVKIIRAAKETQAAKANINASILLKELDMEKSREDARKAAAARRRERKKRRKQEKREAQRKANGEVVSETNTKKSTATSNSQKNSKSSKSNKQLQRDEDPESEESNDEEEEEEEEDDSNDEDDDAEIEIHVRDREEGDSGIDQESCSSSDVKASAAAASSSSSNNNNNTSSNQRHQNESESQQTKPSNSNHNNNNNNNNSNKIKNARANHLETVPSSSSSSSTNSARNTIQSSSSNNNNNNNSNNNINNNNNNQSMARSSNENHKNFYDDLKKSNANNNNRNVQKNQKIGQSGASNNNHNNATKSTPRSADKENSSSKMRDNAGSNNKYLETAKSSSHRKSLVFDNSSKGSSSSNVGNAEDYEIDYFKTSITITPTNSSSSTASVKSKTNASPNKPFSSNVVHSKRGNNNNSSTVDDEWKEVVRKPTTATSVPSASSNIEIKKIQVPLNAISRVIGRGGSNINAIRAATGAHIEVEKQGKTQVDRSITIKGVPDATKLAHNLISTLVKDPDADILSMLPRNNFQQQPIKQQQQQQPIAPPISSSSSSVSSSGNILQTSHSAPLTLPSMTITTSSNVVTSSNAIAVNNGTSVWEKSLNTFPTVSNPVKPASNTATLNAQSTTPTQQMSGNSNNSNNNNNANNKNFRTPVAKNLFASNSNANNSSNNNNKILLEDGTKKAVNVSSVSSKTSIKGIDTFSSSANQTAPTSSGDSFASKLGKSNEMNYHSVFDAKSMINKPHQHAQSASASIFNKIAPTSSNNVAAVATSSTRSITPIGPPNKNISNSPHSSHHIVNTLDLSTPILAAPTPTSTSVPLGDLTTHIQSTLNELHVTTQGHEYSLFNTFNKKWQSESLGFNNPLNVATPFIESEPPVQIDISKAPGYRGNSINSPISSKTSSNSTTPPSASSSMNTNFNNNINNNGNGNNNSQHSSNAMGAVSSNNSSSYVDLNNPMKAIGHGIQSSLGSLHIQRPNVTNNMANHYNKPNLMFESYNESAENAFNPMNFVGMNHVSNSRLNPKASAFSNAHPNNNNNNNKMMSNDYNASFVGSGNIMNNNNINSNNSAGNIRMSSYAQQRTHPRTPWLADLGHFNSPSNIDFANHPSSSSPSMSPNNNSTMNPNDAISARKANVRPIGTERHNFKYNYFSCPTNNNNSNNNNSNSGGPLQMNAELDASGMNQAASSWGNDKNISSQWQQQQQQQQQHSQNNSAMIQRNPCESSNDYSNAAAAMPDIFPTVSL
jgi:ankyrin repeat domain-containing protein 17